MERLSRREQDTDTFITRLEALETTYLKQATDGAEPAPADPIKAMASMIGDLLYAGYEMWEGKFSNQCMTARICAELSLYAGCDIAGDSFLSPEICTHVLQP